jgi:hypothetical protein
LHFLALQKGCLSKILLCWWSLSTNWLLSSSLKWCHFTIPAIIFIKMSGSAFWEIFGN